MGQKWRQLLQARCKRHEAAAAAAAVVVVAAAATAAVVVAAAAAAAAAAASNCDSNTISDNIAVQLVPCLHCFSPPSHLINIVCSGEGCR